MTGILNKMPPGILMDPRTAMMMQTGFGLMGASGPSNMPVSFGQALGQAGMQGMNAFQQANQANQQQQMHQLQLAEVAREQEKRKQQEAAASAFKAQFPQFAGLFDVSQSAAVERAYPKPSEAASPYGKVTPKDYTRDSWAKFTMTNNYADLVPVAPDKGPMSDLGKLESDYKAGLITPADYAAKKKKLIEHGPLVQFPDQEDAFQKRVGQEMGDQYSGLLKADMNAPATIGKYQRLGSLLSNVNTGKFKGTTLELKAAAKAMGFDLSALGVADDLAPAQAARALSNQIALELRNPAGGAGMPGALSDKDREFLVQSIPGLENDPAAIPLMIEYRVKLAKREQQVAKMARAYRKKHNRFDEGFYDELAAWSERNPLFDSASLPTPAAPKPTGLTPEEEAELSELRKRLNR